MGRTIQDTFFATTIPSGTVGADPAGALITELATRMAAVMSNGVSAWAQIDTGVVTNIGNYAGVTIMTIAGLADVYRSVGDRNLASGGGDSSTVVGFTQSSGTVFRLACGYDYSSTQRRIVTGATSAPALVLTAAVDLNLYGSINEYEGIIIINQGVTWDFLMWGSPVRTQVPRSHRGSAFATQAITGGAGPQQITLGRDLTNELVVGEDVWIVNQTLTGTALEPVGIEVLPVISKGANFVELNPVNSYISGALIGLDPVPAGHSPAADSTSWTGAVTEDGVIGTFSQYLARIATTVIEATVDPSDLGFGRGYRHELEGVNPTIGTSHRGVSSIVSWWTNEGQDYPGAGDFNRANLDDTKKFAAFPIFTGLTGYQLNLGPFETVMT